MNVAQTGFSDLVVVEFPVYADDRGSFQRLHCNNTFRDLGLVGDFVQSNLATNIHRDTLRGMHFQVPPYSEDKLVRCVSGRILDVVLDLRRESATFGEHFRIELTAEDGRALLVPKGFAHGYLTLTDSASVLYHVTTAYRPSAEAGIRWNDPRFNISWPTSDPLLSDKDASWSDYPETGI